MTLQIVAGTANHVLADSVAGILGIAPVSAAVERFPDGELRPVVGGMRGADVYLVQPTSPPVNEHVMESLLLIDACRRAGAAQITAVMPYFGYARQDRRGRSGQAIGIRVVADALASAGMRRLDRDGSAHDRAGGDLRCSGGDADGRASPRPRAGGAGAGRGRGGGA
ncbi:ribose-phosphate pyrophosphokinase-like domain-containing protein [Nonomuraea ferruginea]